MLFGLPFLPPREMVEEFGQLREDFEERGAQMSTLYKYVAENWVDHSIGIFAPSGEWSEQITLRGIIGD